MSPMKHCQSKAVLWTSPDEGKYTIVLKIGTSSLIHAERDSINMSGLAKICEVVVDLQREGAAACHRM